MWVQVSIWGVVVVVEVEDFPNKSISGRANPLLPARAILCALSLHGGG